MTSEGRDPRGRFVPGQSGNPAGKTPGTLNHRTRLRQWLADGDEERVARALIAQAGKGNIAAIRMLFDRVDPKPRSRTITLDLPDDARMPEKFEAVFVALAAGRITAEEALMLARFLDHYSKVAGDAPSAAPAAVAPPPDDAPLHSNSILQDAAAQTPPTAPPDFTRRRSRPLPPSA
jgi:hypothetical protein